ncbi:MAG: RNA polymerase sigma factor [Myxococcota bacterium]
MNQDELTAHVLAARNGDRAAQGALVQAFLRPAYAVALGVLRNVADAEDVAQDSLLVALGVLDQCREPARFAAWLLKSVRHRALNLVHQRGHRTRLLGSLPQAADFPPAPLAARQRLVAALAILNPAQREVVLLHDLQDWTHAEVAAALEISETMSRQHLFVARRAMRKYLDDGTGKEGMDGQ